MLTWILLRCTTFVWNTSIWLIKGGGMKLFVLNSNTVECWRCLGFWGRVVSWVDDNVSEKHADSIFRAEVTRLVSWVFMWDLRNECYISPVHPSLVILALKMETACFSETLASTHETTRPQNPRRYQHTNRRENLKSHLVIQFIALLSLQITLKA
jgi:hypothetical protein